MPADTFNNSYIGGAIGGLSAESVHSTPMIVCNDDINYITNADDPKTFAAVATSTTGARIISCTGFRTALVYYVGDTDFTLTAGAFYCWGRTPPASIHGGSGARPFDYDPINFAESDGPGTWVNLPCRTTPISESFGNINILTATPSWANATVTTADYYVSAPKTINLHGCTQFMISVGTAFVGESTNSLLCVRFTT